VIGGTTATEETVRALGELAQYGGVGRVGGHLVDPRVVRTAAAPGDQAHVLASFRQQPGDRSTDRTCTNYDLHREIPSGH
jgi:hypothetical protein